MNFSTLFFVFAFLPVSLILYLICPRVCKNALLVLISFVFYAWGSPIALLLLLCVTVFNYCISRDIGSRVENGLGGAKGVLAAGIVFNLLLLGFYKYSGFLSEGLNLILPVEIHIPTPALPLGISFFTFQNISCLSDVYHRRAPAQKSPLDFCLYVSFFPKMISGPIVPYAQMAPQLQSHPVTVDKVADGVPLLVVGLAKKVLLADNFAQTFGAITALDATALSGGSAWLGVLCYALQLYFDFSGYSDMAIGMAKLFGFDFDKNFDYPYISASLTEFWRRWHISLGRWFRDYVYIPLGGSRVSTAKCIRNLLIVWLLTGLWHGASLPFVVWGLYHGLLLLLEKYALKDVLEKVPSPIRHILTLFCVLIGWVFFFSPDLASAFSFLGRMFGAGSRVFWDSTAKYYFSSNWMLLAAGVLGSTPLIEKLYTAAIFQRRDLRLIFSAALLLGVFLLCVPYMMNATYQSFLYAQF